MGSLNVKRRVLLSLLYAIQTINRKTAWANGLKRKLGLWNLATRVFVKKVDEQAKREIVASLRENIVTDKVARLSRQGIDNPLFVVLHIERMGDLVAAEISRYLKTLAPRGTTRWVVKKAFRDIVAFNPWIDEVVEVANLSEAEDYCRKAVEDPRAVFINCVLHRTACPVTNRIFPNENNPAITVFTFYAVGNLLETSSLAAGLPRLKDAPVFHFRKDVRLPAELVGKRYVVFHCRSDDPGRDWSENKWRELADHVSSCGYLVVEIGEKQALEEVAGKIVCLTGRRNLQDLAFIVKNAAFFIGVDSGFAHVANATRRPSVIMVGRFGTFTGHDIWSGEFAHSSQFRVLRARGEELAKTIDVHAAMDAFDTLSISGSVQ